MTNFSYCFTVKPVSKQKPTLQPPINRDDRNSTHTYSRETEASIAETVIGTINVTGRQRRGRSGYDDHRDKIVKSRADVGRQNKSAVKPD